MDIQFIQANHLNFLFLQHPASQSYFNVFMLYLLFCVPISIIIMYFIPRRFQKSDLYVFLFFMVWSVFIPVFGIIILIIGVYLLRYYARHYTQVEVVTSIQKQYGSEKFAKLSPYGAGWAYTRIFNESFSKEDRERALYAINKLRTQQVNDVNRALLDDDTYEIRLYAFNILNKEQTFITNAIKKYLDIRETVTNSSELAQVNKSLAYLYWEYFLLNSNLGELADEILKKAYVCVTNAVEFFTNDSNLWMLLAKIFKASNQDDKYRKTLEAISGFEYVPVEAYLNLAELSYEEHNYDLVRTYLGNKSSSYDISTNAFLIKFWCHHE